MPYLYHQNYQSLAMAVVMHAFGLLAVSLVIPGDQRFVAFFWLWWIWPVLMAWVYSSQRLRWIIPVAVALPIWSIATWKFMTQAT